MGRRRKKYRSKGIAINLMKTAAVGGTAYYLFNGVTFSNFGWSTLGQVVQNLRANLKDILIINLAATGLNKLLGKWAPRTGVKGALSVKAF